MNNAKPTYFVDADKLLSSHPKEIWAFRELFLLLVKRDFVAVYKQTVLGPLWFFVQPFLASLVFMVVFGEIARLPTTDLPPLVLGKYDGKGPHSNAKTPDRATRIGTAFGGIASGACHRRGGGNDWRRVYRSRCQCNHRAYRPGQRCYGAGGYPICVSPCPTGFDVR
jgi:hypothetical protein